jgi:hypothetical protein
VSLFNDEKYVIFSQPSNERNLNQRPLSSLFFNIFSMNILFDVIKRLLCCGDEDFKAPETQDVAIQAPSPYGGSQHFTSQTSLHTSVRGSVRSDRSIHLPTHGSVHNSFNGTVPWSTHGSVRASTKGSMNGSVRSNPFINNSFFEPPIYGGSALSSRGSLGTQHGQTWSSITGTAPYKYPHPTEYAPYQRSYPPVKRN